VRRVPAVGAAVYQPVIEGQELAGYLHLDAALQAADGWVRAREELMAALAGLGP